MSSSKLGSLLKWSVSSPSDGSLSVSMKFNFSKTPPGFSCRLIFPHHFYFLVHCQIPILKSYNHYLQMHLHHLLELLCCSIFTKPFDPFGEFSSFKNPGLAAPFVAFDPLWKPGLFLGFDNSFSLMVLLQHFLDPVLNYSVEWSSSRW